MRLIRASCWASFSPKTAMSGRTRVNSFSTMVSTPSKWPGRLAPSLMAMTGNIGEVPSVGTVESSVGERLEQALGVLRLEQADGQRLVRGQPGQRDVGPPSLRRDPCQLGDVFGNRAGVAPGDRPG